MIGIDIGSGCVKVVTLQRRGGAWRVAGHGVAAVPAGKDGPAPDTAALARAIRGALDQARAGRAEAMCALPRHAAALRHVSLPGAPSRQLAQAALLEAGRSLPFAPTDATAGVRLWPTAEGEETKAVVAAAPGDVVDACRTAAATAGVTLCGLGVSSLAAAEAMPAPGDEPWMLLDIGAHSVTAEVIAGGMPCASHVALMGGEHLTRAFATDLGCDEESAEQTKNTAGLTRLNTSGGESALPSVVAWLDQLSTEVHLLLTACAAQRQPLPVRIYLAGGGGMLAGLPSVLERALGLPVEPLVVKPLEEAGVPHPLQYAAAYAMATAAATQAETLDLVATEVRRVRAARRRRSRMWAASIAGLLFLGGASVPGYRAWRAHGEAVRAHAAVSRDLAATQSVARGLTTRRQTLLAQTQSLRAALSAEHPWVNVLNELAVRAPEGVWLTGIELERGKPLVVRGTALRAEQAADFVSALGKSPLLEQARLSFANDAELNRRQVVQFGITALVRGNAPEARPTATKKRAPKPAKQEDPDA